MRTVPIDPVKYAGLLTQVLPAAIATEEEYQHLLAEIEQLLAKGDSTRTAEEDRLLATLMVLVQAYEDREHPIPPATPHETLHHLMESRGLRQADLLGVFGTRSVASAVINGKREISKAQAKRLAQLFHVSAEVFL